MEEQLKEVISNSSRPIPENPPPWWTKKLTVLKKILTKVNYKLRRCPKDLITSTILHTVQKTTRLLYRKEIHQAKMTAWRKFTSQNKAWEFLYAVLRKSNTAPLGNLQRDDAMWTTTTEETSELLLRSKFPEGQHLSIVYN